MAIKEITLCCLRRIEVRIASRLEDKFHLDDFAEVMWPLG
jgi:hypothetical protein